jgi:hypothetical protein
MLSDFLPRTFSLLLPSPEQNKVIGALSQTLTRRSTVMTADEAWNPAFALQIAGAGFQAAIDQRWSALSEGARNMIQVLAVAGQELPIHDLAEMTGNAEPLSDAVTQIDDCGLAATDHGRVRMSHDLIASAVRDQIPYLQRRAMHGRLAAYFLDVADDVPAAADQARQASVAPGDTAAARVSITVAERLAEADPAVAGELIAAAFDALDPRQSAWLTLSQRCLAVLARTGDAGQAVTIADQILADGADPALAGRVEIEVARALLLSGRTTELTDRIDHVLSANPQPQPAQSAQLRAIQALAAARSLPTVVAAPTPADEPVR